MKTQLQFLAYGAVSGILSWLFANTDTNNDYTNDYTFYIFTGLTFGVVVYIMSKRYVSISTTKGLAWIIVSITSFYIAVQEALYIATQQISAPEHYVPFLLGGAVGAFLMLLGFHLFILELNWKSVLVLTLLGGVLGLGFLVNFNSILPLFLIWQTGMILAIGNVLLRKSQQPFLSPKK